MAQWQFRTDVHIPMYLKALDCLRVITQRPIGKRQLPLHGVIVDLEIWLIQRNGLI
jgi:hypothetical protein